MTARIFSRSFRIAPLLACVLLAGCTDMRPVYKEPPAAEDAAALLVGRDGTYINEVDGARVRSGESTTDTGGNTVKVTPGEHRVQAYTLAKGARGAGEFQFTFRFERGRAYELSPSSEIALSLQVKDRTTGQVVNVN